MHSGKVIFTICAFAILAISAYPAHRDTGEASWIDFKANEAHYKSKLLKETDMIHKSLVDDGGLNNHEAEYKNPVSEETRHKILVESERLRARLRQELGELRQMLAPSPADLASALAGLREHLTPLTQQLHNNTHSLCHWLRLYLLGPDAAVAKHGPVVHHQIKQTLEWSGSRLTDILADLMAKTREVTERLGDMSEAEAANAHIWQGFSSRLGREVTSLKVETQNSLETLKVQLTDQSESTRSLSAMVERFCQNAARQHQDFQARIETLFTGTEDELQVQSSFPYSRGSLQEDFSIKLSALIQDILHSLQ
ncbi:uncharacterized protein zgc:162608 [Syngnathoides biaculeatus]|uniref:uncharacterized protein zgc:162608 n=1 Tax=Syngnathoides biaculeatus TaxID=300417 RepID=UPI002ADD7FD1|nr:uncharacterized protein zgc:162608 [Syngnathoides biaculeatus]